MKFLILFLLSQGVLEQLNKPISESEFIVHDIVTIMSPTNYVSYYKKRAEFDGMLYTIGTDDNNIIKLIITADTNFVTDEGFSTRTKVMNLTKYYQDKLKPVGGYSYQVNLESGWTACFVTDKDIPNNQLKKTDTISFFFIEYK